MGSKGRSCCPTFSSTRECGRILTACGGGAVDRSARVAPQSERKRWNLEHVVLDLFSHFTMGKIQWSLSAHV